MKKILMMFMVCLLWCNVVFAETKMPKIAAQGAVLVDGDSGRVLWGKNEDVPLTMASTTKIMTAIVILEYGNLDDMVKVSKKAANAAKVRMGLSVDEEVREEDLLYAMMLRSYNDAAVALAEHIGGSVEGFCNMMTEKAKEIHAKDTVFNSPNGLDSNLSFEQHHSTAYDMALIARYALANPKFVEIINTSAVDIPMKGGTGKHYSVTNANRFLNSYDGAFGVKTGYTNKAGQCFVGAAKRGDKTFITTVLGSGWGSRGKEQKWEDTKNLMDYGFENYEKRTLVQPGKFVGNTKVIHSPVKYVPAVLKKGYTALFCDEELQRIEVKVFQKEKLEAPLQAGEKLGYIEILLDDAVLDKIELIATKDANKYTLNEMLHEMSKQWGELDIFLQKSE